MTFTPNSGLVKVWVSLAMAGTYMPNQVPALYNLKMVVEEIVNRKVA